MLVMIQVAGTLSKKIMSKTIQEFKKQYLEVKEKRSGFSKTFDKGNGSHVLVATQSLLHWKDKNSNFQEIDCSIENCKVEKTVYTATLLTDTIGYSIIADEDNSRIDVKLNSIGNKKISYVAPTIEENKAIWYDIDTDVDFIIEFTPVRVRCWKRLKTNKAAKDITFVVVEDDNEKVLKVVDKIVGYDNSGKRTKQKVDKGEEQKYKTNGTQKNVKEYEVKQIFEDKVVVRNEQTRVKGLSEEVSYPVMIDADVSITISDTANDGVDQEEMDAPQPYINAGMTTNNYYNRIAYYIDDQGTPYPRSYPWQRFGGITIPQSSAINSATLNLYMVGNYIGTGATEVVNVNALDSSDPDAFIADEDTGVLIGKNTTRWVNNGVSPISGSTNMNNFTSTSLGTDDTMKAKETFGLFGINVEDIVQELVNTYDYSDDAMLFFQRFARTTTLATKPTYGIFVYDRDWGNSGRAPQLVISYTIPAVPPVIHIGPDVDISISQTQPKATDIEGNSETDGISDLTSDNLSPSPNDINTSKQGETTGRTDVGKSSSTTKSINVSNE